MESILTLNNVGVTYGGKCALHDVTIAFPKNQITAVIGPSGYGKSTLLHAINRMLEETPDAVVTGEILLEGSPTARLPTAELRRKIGLVFQRPQPFPLSIYGNMVYVPRYDGIRDKKTLDALVRDKLELVGLYDEVKEHLNQNALQLSGGQQQRLCIARALTANPSVLLLDEPCSALDVKSTAVIEELLLRLKAHYTLILVTHNMAQARRIADRVAFLYGGTILEYGTKDAVFGNPRQPETRDFLDGVFG